MKRVLPRLLNAARPNRAEPDLSRELAEHLAMLEEQYQRRGMMPHEARRAARLAIGGVEQTKELHRDARSFRFGIVPLDPATFIGVSVVVILLAAIASWVPVRRAAAVDPLRAIRYE